MVKLNTSHLEKRIPTIWILVFIGLGAALGVVARTILESWWPAKAEGFPWVTFIINIVGSLLLAVLLETLSWLGDDTGWRKTTRFGIGTGFFGGFTTYSTFILETSKLLINNAVLLGITYSLVSVMLGVLAAYMGIAVSRKIYRRIAVKRAKI